mmetsp:Transcript_81822/g.250024  ORF Transcript_81822/g.250024 Transcript_81822/m.250024 type:complete len:309 (+) Transcript_81822:137-1063(+)
MAQPWNATRAIQACKTTFRGLPSAKARKLPAVMAMRRSSASWDLYATCGVSTTWSAGTPRIGSSAGIGSVSNTSSPARNLRCDKSCAMAFWSMTPPRATFTKTEAGRKRSSKDLFTKPIVCALSATCTDTTSERSKSSSRPTCFPAIGAAANFGFSWRDHPNNSLGPKARNNSAVRMPMSPRPTMPITLLRNSKPPMECAQPPPRMVRSPPGISRNTDNAKPTESSATASVEYAGTFTTLIPRFLHASRSTWLKPVNDTATTLHFGCLSNTSSVTGLVTVTMASASEPAARAHSTSNPWPFSVATASS